MIAPTLGSGQAGKTANNHAGVGPPTIPVIDTRETANGGNSEAVKADNPMTPTKKLRHLLPITKKSLTANDNRYDVYDKKSNTRKINKSLRSSMHANKKAVKRQ